MRLLEPAVAVTQQLHRHRVDAGVTGILPLGKRRQFAVVTAGQVLADGADFRLYDVKMIEQPFSRRRDELTLVDVVRERFVRRSQQSGVVAKSRFEPLRPPFRTRDGEPCGERLRTLFQPLDAQQFVAKGFLRGRSATHSAEAKGHTVLDRERCRARA